MIKVLAEVHIPIIEEQYDIFIPNNKSIRTVIKLLEKAVNELSDGSYQNRPTTLLYDQKTGLPYEINKSVKNSGIVNGSKIILY